MSPKRSIFIFACTLWLRFLVYAGASPCTQPPVLKICDGVPEAWITLGSSLTLNCTALLPWEASDPQCDSTLRWTKDGLPLSNRSLWHQNDSMWLSSKTQAVVSSLLVFSLKEPDDFGLFVCEVRNVSSTFRVHKTAHPSHTSAVVAAVVLLLLLGLAALLYTRCRLDIQLCLKNSYGKYEINDGKIYDAYVSYVSDENDRKFVNFILKPHMENRYGHKLYLNDIDIMPNSEPSAELLMNVSRCRRLVVVLSQAYMEQEWCLHNFKQGLLHLLELSSQPPIFITFESQKRRLSPDIAHHLKEHQHHVTLLVWRAHSMTPSSSFWKELGLVMPRKVVFRSDSAGDPQTLLQNDKDPMLTLDLEYQDGSPDLDPAGDLGLRTPVYKALTPRAPVLPPAPAPVLELKPGEIDVSDLGLRNYGARTDFYCLVTKDDL